MERHMPLGDLATWVSAAATFAAVVVALYFSLAESRRHARAAERAQAERITASLSAESPSHGNADQAEGIRERGGIPATVVVRNASNEVAYRLIATVVDFSADEDAPRDGEDRFRAFLGEVLPGTVRALIEHPGPGMSFRAGVEVAFQDAGGRNWRRKAQGRLVPLEQDPASYYRLVEPLPW